MFSSSTAEKLESRWRPQICIFPLVFIVPSPTLKMKQPLFYVLKPTLYTSLTIANELLRRIIKMSDTARLKMRRPVDFLISLCLRKTWHTRQLPKRDIVMMTIYARNSTTLATMWALFPNHFLIDSVGPSHPAVELVPFRLVWLQFWSSIGGTELTFCRNKSSTLSICDSKEMFIFV